MRSVRSLGLVPLVVLSFAWLVPTWLSAGEPEKPNLAVRIQGTLGKGGSLRLAVETGALASRSLMVFSEPSHTLLLLVVDTEFAKTDAGREWLEALQRKSQPVVTVTTTLPNAEPLVETKGRPLTDDRVAVWAVSQDATGKQLEMLLADAQVGNRDFAFSTFVEPGTDERITHCCTGSVCGTNCVDCGGPRFTCCLNAPPMECCWIGCNWVPCPC